MSTKLTLTELEFQTIKNNLKNYLRNQQTFKDYDFEGSALNQLLDVLAYNTYYNAYYLNMVANESNLETASVRDVILSHAKSLNYVPTSRRGAVANVNVTVTPPGGNTQVSATINRFTPFESEAIDGVNYTFVAKQSYTAFKENGMFPFTNVELIEGIPQTATFTYNAATNPRAEFEIPDNTIDTSTLYVVVQESVVNTSTSVFTPSIDITGLNSNSQSYFLSTTTDNKYKLIFGDGNIAKSLANGNIVIAQYLVTNGDAANKANAFATGSISGFSNVQITAVSAAAGGAERETDDSIKFNAPLFYSSQNRAVTTNDYAVLIQKNYPNIRSVSVWGGEDNDPPVYDTVFISYIPRDGALINDVEKNRITTEILDPLKIVTVSAVLTDPEYLYLKFNSTLKVNQRLTSLTTTQIQDAIRSTILNYVNTNLNQFNSTFASSKIESAIDSAIPAIVGSDTEIQIEKRITPLLQVSQTYTIYFRTSLKRSTVTTGLQSTGFYVYDALGIKRLSHIEEVFNSFTGVDAIEITNPGFGYTEAPTLTIVGDGTGATAEASIINGRVTGITITNRGTGYTTATILFSGGGGQQAAATPVIAARYGTLRLYYNKSNAEKETINANIGTINYETGTVTINSLKVDSVDAVDGQIRFSIEPESAIIQTKNNQLITVDQSDIGAILIEVDVV